MTRGTFVFICALFAAIAYSGVTVYPSALFSSSYSYKNLTLYTHDPLKEPPNKILSEIYERISADDFYDAGQSFEVYLAGSYAEYVFLAPFCRKDASCAHPVSDKIFIASSDMDKDLAYGPRGGGLGRNLGRVITHEIVKTQIKNKMGALDYFFMSDWRKEGYAEHVAMETRDLAPASFCEGSGWSDPALPYLKNRLIVELIVLEDSLSYPVLMKTNYSYESAQKRVENRYCGK